VKINRFSDLTVWQKAHELTLATYKLTSRDLGHVSADEFEGMNSRCDSVGQLINALGQSLKNRLG